MARVNFSGAETGSIGTSAGKSTPELVFTNSTALAVVQSTIKRSGNFAWQCDSGASNNPSYIIPTGPTITSRTGFLRCYFCFDGLPTTDVIILQVGSFLTDLKIKLTTTGKLQLWANNAQVGSDSSATIVADSSTFYRIEISATGDASGIAISAELRLDGVTVASDAVTTSSSEPFGFTHIGWIDAPGANLSIYLDDYAANDSTGANQNSWPGDGHVVLLKPTADSAVGTSWTTSAGASTSLFDCVDNEPPIGIADTTANAGHQIRNAGSSTASYDVTLQSYTAAGIGSSDTINVLIPIINTAAPVVTGAKTGSVGVVSNPTISNIAFINGATAAANFWSGVAAGTFPTGWKWERGTVTHAPTVTKGTGPVMRVTITGGTSSRVAMVDFMGLSVDYTPSGTAYTESATVSSSSSVSSVETAQNVESATITGKTTPSSTDLTATLDATMINGSSSVASAELHTISDSSTITGLSTPSSSDVTAYIETGTLINITTPSSTELHEIPDSSTINSTTMTSAIDVAAFVESSTISNITSLSSTDLREASPDAATLSSVTTATATEVTAYVESTTTSNTTSVSATELHGIPDSATIDGTTSISSTDFAADIESGTFVSLSNPSGTEFAQYSDDSVLATGTSITSTEAAAYTDSDAASSITTPISTEFHGTSDSSTVSGNTILDTTTQDTAQFVESSTLSNVTSLSATELLSGIDSDTPTNMTSLTSADVAAYREVSTIPGITSVISSEQITTPGQDASTGSTTTIVSSLEFAAYVDAAAVQGSTQITAQEVHGVSYTDNDTPSSATVVATSDLAAFIDSSSCSITTNINSSERVDFVDASTTTGTTSTTSGEFNSSTYTDADSPTVATTTNYTEVAQYVEAQQTIAGTTTAFSTEVAAYSDFSSAGSITSLSATESKTSGNTDLATVTGITYVNPIEYFDVKVISLVCEGFRRKWYVSKLEQRFELVL